MVEGGCSLIHQGFSLRKSSREDNPLQREEKRGAHRSHSLSLPRGKAASLPEQADWKWVFSTASKDSLFYFFDIWLESPPGKRKHKLRARIQRERGKLLMAQKKDFIKCVNNCIRDANRCFCIPTCRRSSCLVPSCSGYRLIKCYILSSLGTVVTEKQKTHLKACLGTFSLFLSGKDGFTYSFWNSIVLYKKKIWPLLERTPPPPPPLSLLFPSIPLHLLPFPCPFHRAEMANL